MKINLKSMAINSAKLLASVVVLAFIVILFALNGEALTPVIESFQTHKGSWFVWRLVLYACSVGLIMKVWQTLPERQKTEEEEKTFRKGVQKMSRALLVFVVVVETMIWLK